MQRCQRHVITKDLLRPPVDRLTFSSESKLGTFLSREYSSPNLDADVLLLLIVIYRLTSVEKRCEMEHTKAFLAAAHTGDTGLLRALLQADASLVYAVRVDALRYLHAG